MKEIITDIVVIGAGPAGQKAAIQASKLNKKVIVIDRFGGPGGNCLYTGTIPSKSLREAIIDLTRFNEREFRGYRFGEGEVNFEDLNNRLVQVLEENGRMVSRQLKKNNIELIQGIARFENPHMAVVVDDEYRMLYQIKSDYFIIATGSKPRNPNNIPFDNTVILDSTRLLGLKAIPSSMIVLGGGIIGSEYASFFAALGTEVTIIDRKEHILPMLDSEIGIHLQTALMDIGLKFKGKKEPTVIQKVDNHAVVQCQDGSVFEADTLLYALGRTANIDSLHTENTGLVVNEKGYVVVNEFFQTSVPHIYAIGDVIGGASLASTSMEQGRLAARHACKAESHQFPSFFPIGIYTLPEISSCGYTEEELKAIGFHYEVGRAYYYELARSHITGSKAGMFKILFHAETLEILGVHIVGRNATEVIHIGEMAIGFHAKIDYFIDQVFNYPTFAEGYRVAALNGYNKIKHKR